MKGIVVKYDADRGFGFIRPEEQTNPNTKDAFVHISNIQDGSALEIGQKVIFDLEYSEKGPVAKNVVPGPKSKSPWAIFGILSSILILFSMLGCRKLLPSIGWLGAYFIGINFCTMIMYFYDKKAAGNPSYMRVPEIILHALAFFGGTPAAFISQYFFRHKTIKGKFRIVFWLVLAVQIIIIWQIFDFFL